MSDHEAAAPQKTLYLVRHGEAKSADDDPSRPLTNAGREAVAKMGRWAASVGLHVDEIRHSGKLRAQQTAEILAELLQFSEVPLSAAGLGPNDDVQPVAEALTTEQGTIMLVGHLPFLGRLVSYLVLGDADQPLVEFEAAGLVALRHRDDRWMISSVQRPELLG